MDSFKTQCKTMIAACKDKWSVDIATTSDSFVRCFIESEGVTIKVDFVNDVSFHYGQFEHCSIFHRVDNWRNILSNKLCALSRMEVKDLADIVYISQNYTFEWEDIINEAREKDLWAEPLEVCRMINEFPLELLSEIKWIKEINLSEIKRNISVLHDDIFRGNSNSLFSD
jgi:hypothetical protein